MSTQTKARCESGKCGVTTHIVGTAAYRDCTREARRNQDKADNYVIANAPKLASGGDSATELPYPIDLSKLGGAAPTIESILDQEYVDGDGLTKAEYISTHGGISRIEYTHKEEGSGRAFRAYYASPEDGGPQYMEFPREEELIVKLFEAEDTTTPEEAILLRYEKINEDRKAAFADLKWARHNDPDSLQERKDEYHQLSQEASAIAKEYNDFKNPKSN